MARPPAATSASSAAPSRRQLRSSQSAAALARASDMAVGTVGETGQQARRDGDAGNEIAQWTGGHHQQAGELLIRQEDGPLLQKARASSGNP